MKEDSQQLQGYYIIKKSLQIPLKLQLYFNMLQAVIQNNNETLTHNQYSRCFFQAFKKQTLSEQAHFMSENIKFIAKAIIESDHHKIEALRNPNTQINTLLTSAQLSVTKMKIPYWVPIKFKLNKKQREILIITNKKTTIIDLQKYLVRQSKKVKGSIVLDLAEDTQNETKKYAVYFKRSTADEFYREILGVIIVIRNQRLLSLLRTENNSILSEDNDKSWNNNKNLVLLSSKNINDYLNSKDKFLKYLLNGKFQFQQLSFNQTDQIHIFQSKKAPKIFKMSCVKNITSKKIKEGFLDAYMTKNKYLASSQVLENFSKGRYKAIYEKYMINGKSQQLISIKQQIYTCEKNDSQQTLMFVHCIQNIMIPNFLEFMVAKAQHLSNESSKLMIICEINLTELITSKIVQLFLRQLSDMLDRKDDEIHELKEEFYTVYGEDFDEQIGELVEFVEAEEEFKGNLDIGTITSQNLSMFDSKIYEKYRLKKFLLTPVSDYSLKENLLKQHYLFKQWIRTKEGGILCTNQAIINEQKKMFKYVITTFGNNILKGNSILNISLPVTIFRKESHLYSIARNFSFAPLLLQNINDPLQRIKMATLLTLSIGLLGISMDKPFNPILGETLQVWIGGCPMYLEQISHHPPITAYQFYGRGYRIHGQIQPKISFGMNNVKGYSDRPNYIIFDDGSQLELLFGKMVIHGLLYGDRIFDFTDKVYVYDKTNGIYSELNYGPRKKSMIMKNSEPKDFVYGKIYKLRSEFMEKFKETPYPSKDFILKQLSDFEGLWTEVIRFENKPYLNFKQDLPCSITDEARPLPSNSHFRQDLACLCEGDIQKSQQQKQILQQIQRRDRKLRQTFAKK